MTVLGAAELGEVAVFIRGITFTPDDVVPVGTPGAAACMRTKNVQADLDLSDVWGIPESFVKRDDQYLVAGDLLVSSANSWNLVGKCCRVPDLPWRATFGGFISALRADPAKIDPRYLYRWFSSPRIQATVRSFGQKTTNISNLNIDRCRRLSVPLPPLSEQRRIAEILDKADALRARRRAALAQLDTLTESIFLEMFGDPATNPMGWPRVPLSALCSNVDDIKCGPFGTQLTQSEFRSVGVPLWGIRHVNALFREPTREFVDESTARRLSQYSLEAGDIVMTRKGTIGNCAVYPATLQPGIMHSDLLRIRMNRDVCAAVFAAHQLHTSRDVERQLALISGGAVMPGINVTKLKNLAIVVPPHSLQRTFVGRVAATEQARILHEKAIGAVDELLSSLQDLVFRDTL